LKILVTGAEGFVGARVVRCLVTAGHEVIAAVRPGSTDPRPRFGPQAGEVRIVPMELTETASVRAAAATGPEAVIHLAALASGGEARKDPIAAWTVNAVGTARLAGALGSDPTFLVVSTAEVYGAGSAVPHRESDATVPCSPYGASKLAAEIAALEVHRRVGLKVIIARPFPHIGPGQTEHYVVPAFVARIQEAKRISARAVRVGNLTPVREFLHVDDVVEAYCRLVGAGRPGEVYNVASGRAITLEEVFHQLCELIEYHPLPEIDPGLVRTADIPYLVGDGGKLRAATGWAPRLTLEQTLREIVDAKAD
jgi:GDP-4-dehydro-6-deoxy-D-mannose reductase